MIFRIEFSYEKMNFKVGLSSKILGSERFFVPEFGLFCLMVVASVYMDLSTDQYFQLYVVKLNPNLYQLDGPFTRHFFL